MGIWGYDYLALQPSLLWLVSIISLVTALFFHLISSKFYFFKIPFSFCAVLLFITIGYNTRTVSDHLQDKNHFTHYPSTDTQTFLLSIEESLKPTAYQDKYVASLHKVDDHASSGRILLNISKDSLDRSLEIGAWYYVRAPLLDLPSPKNPYQFDYGSYLERKQIYGQLNVTHSKIAASESKNESLRVWSSRFRESVQDSLRSHSFNKRHLAIIEALVLGQKQGIDKEISAQYAASGMMHILAVSGLHVGILLLILRFIFKPLRSRKWRWAKSLIIVILVWSFAFITGLSPSVLRAATMFSFLELGETLGGKRKSQDAVLASALFLLLYDPLLIYQVGFQLSYLAVMAILWVQPWLAEFWIPKNYFLTKIRDAGSVTIAAQLGVMPLSLFYFHQFPGLFFISNVLIIPFLGLILGGGLLVSALAFIGMLPDVFVFGYGLIIDLMNGFIGWVARQESFITRHISISGWVMAGSYLFLIALFSFLVKYSAKRLAFVTCATVLITALILFERTYPERPHLAILNKSKSTLITTWDKGILQVFQNDSLFEMAQDTRIDAYQDALNVQRLKEEKLGSYLRFKQKELLVIDSLGVYDLAIAHPTHILLTQSPRINLERLIARFPRATIIADGSNYRSYVNRWKATCMQRKIPFHSTYEKGAFMID